MPHRAQAIATSNELSEPELSVAQGAVGPASLRLQEEIARLRARLQRTGEAAQMANVDLQNTLQKQQQTLQMLSNISKMLFDTSQSVIRKIGG